jgi:CubicO group peptidase (beta-lactamase class C family)
MRTWSAERFDELVERLLSKARVPGAAIAVVREGEVVHAKGYGTRDQTRTLPVTVETLFPIASTTKAMTATVLCHLVDRNELQWQRPVRDYLPEFTLRDPGRSAYVSLRDLVTMRTGLPRHDWMWIDNPFPRADLPRRLAHLELTAGFREQFQYNNLTVTLAGHIAECVTGQSWEALTKAILLDPLRMARTQFGLPLAGDFTCSWCEDSHRELVMSHPYEARHTGPSGGAIVSCVEDMAKWVMFNLERTAIGGRKLLHADSVASLYRPHVLISGNLPGSSERAAYGLGWQFDDYHGTERIFHGGYLYDINSDVSLFPSQGIGCVAFVNAGGSRLAECLNGMACDLLMGREPSAAWREKLDSYERKIRLRMQAHQKSDAPCTSASSADFDGDFLHPAYGTISLRQMTDHVEMRRGPLTIRLREERAGEWSDPLSSAFGLHETHPWDRANPVRIETDRRRVHSVDIRFEPTGAPIRFTRGGRAPVDPHLTG